MASRQITARCVPDIYLTEQRLQMLFTGIPSPPIRQHPRSNLPPGRFHRWNPAAGFQRCGVRQPRQWCTYRLQSCVSTSPLTTAPGPAAIHVAYHGCAAGAALHRHDPARPTAYHALRDQEPAAHTGAGGPAGTTRSTIASPEARAREGARGVGKTYPSRMGGRD